jgi:hypothetical protein
MGIRIFLAFGSAVAMVCLLILGLTAQRADVMRSDYTSGLTFTPASTAFPPIVASNNAPTFTWPISGAPDSPYLVCDAFGPRLNDDVYDWHRGIDITGTTSTSVTASTSGQVRISASSVFSYPNCGEMIQIQYPDLSTLEYRTNYCHLSQRDVNANDTVSQTQSIGLVGKTSASYHHLHFETREGDQPQNPYCYLPHPDLDIHSVDIISVDTSSLPTSITVTLQVTTPRSELDINEVRVHVLALDQGGKEVANEYVNFNQGHNCGTDNRCVVTGTTQICIDPQHFWCDVSTWDTRFTFSNLPASGLVKVLAEAKDCKGATKQDWWSNLRIYLPLIIK